MTITRRNLQLGLAVIWLLDGALQCQRFMFTRAFARTVLAPAGHGQPGLVAHSVHWASSIVLAHPLLTNTGFAAVQLAIGLGLFTRRWARLALATSFVWGLGVWWFGEGIGGLTTGETLVTGAPGAALLYSVITVLAWPTRDRDASAAPSRWAIPAWATLWAAGAGLQVAGGNNTGMSFSMMFRDAASDNGGWIGRIDTSLSRIHFSNEFVAVLVGIEILVAMWAFVPGRVRHVSVVTGSVIAAVAWLLVQGLGDLTSGQATDPNAGPLILLLALAVLGAQTAPRTAGLFVATEKVQTLAAKDDPDYRVPVIAGVRTDDTS
jgi:hypothetical protein